MHPRLNTIGLVLVAACCLPPVGQAQPTLDPGRALTQYVHEVWQDEQGLPQSSINAIVQTDDGYLWLGTQEGLIRFDGVAFTVFDQRNTPALEASQNIRALHLTGDGTLWIGTFGGGLVRFRDGQFAKVPTTTGFTGTRISALDEAPDGTLWISTFDAGVFAMKGEQARQYDGEDGLPGTFTSTVHVAPDGTLWVGTRDGLYRREGAHFTALTTDDGLPHDFIEELYTDRNGILWISTRGGVVQFRDGHIQRPVPSLPFGEDTVLDFCEDARGRLWMGTKAHGIVRLDGGRFETFSTREGLSYDRVKALAFDREGSLWIGTDGGGLNRLRTGIFTPYGRPEGLAADMINAVYEDAGGALWIGSEEDGLVRYANGKFTPFTAADGLDNKMVVSLYGNKEGTLCVGTYGGGLYRLQDGRFTHYTSADGLPSDEVSALYDDGAGTLWIGTNGGIARLSGGRFTTITTEDGLASPYVISLAPGHNGLWIGTYGGGIQHIEDGRINAHYTAEDGLGNDIVTSLYEDADGTLWIGTYGGGLARLREGRITSYSYKDGLSSNTIYQILEDDQERLWMSSNVGVSFIEKVALNDFADGRTNRLTTTAYSKTDGLRSAEMNGGSQPAGWKDRAGRLWFPSTDGLAMIDPSAISHNEVPPPVVLQSARVDGTLVPLDAMATLAPGSKKIVLQFAALSFIEPGRVAYRYRLDGFDTEWSAPATDRTATFTNLAPGPYSFRVIARNADGVWNETGASVSFYLKPFFYQTTWFLALCLLSVICITFAGYRLRIHQHKARERELERVVDERTQDLRMEKEKTEKAKAVIEAQADKLRELDRFKTRFFANVSHEFRTPLTMIIGPLENAISGSYGAVGEGVRRQLDIMLRNGRRLLRLINQLLDLSKLEAGKMQLRVQARDITAFLEGVLLTITAFAEQKGIHLEFSAPDMPVEMYFEPDKFEKVFFNLLSNATKFTPQGGTIGISVTETAPDPEAPGGQVVIRVSDTGKGIPEEQLSHIFDRFHQIDGSNTREYEGTGIGLSLVMEMIQLHGGTVRAESEIGQGTTFIITLPKGRGHLKAEQIAEKPQDPGALNDLSRSALNELSTSDFNDMCADEIELETSAASDTAPMILVVDDNKDVREYVASILNRHYRIALAQDGQDGLDKAIALQPDLVLSDVMMPRMDGNQLCMAIKADASLNHIPVILLTARATHEQKIEGLEGGADDYMAKPFSARELLVRVKNLLQLRRQELELKELNDRLEARVQEQRDQIVADRLRYEQELITERDRAEASSRLKSTILDNLSHEFRTPITTIQGAAQVLTVEADPPLKEFAAMIKDGSIRLMQTLDALMELASLESNSESKLVLEEVDLVNEMRRAVDGVREQAEEQRLGLHFRGRVNQVVIARVNRQMLRRILNSLLGNALKFTEKGEVTVEVTQQADLALLRVYDTGIGIEAEQLPGLFESFTQGSSGLDRSHEGLGLGLHIAKRLAEKMEGTIVVDSETGRGSVFTVTFPALSANRSGTAQHNRKAPRNQA